MTHDAKSDNADFKAFVRLLKVQAKAKGQETGNRTPESIQSCYERWRTVLEAFAKLACANPSAAVGKAFELNFRYCWYDGISHLRGLPEPSAEEIQLLVNDCIQGTVYYKGLVLELSERYDVDIPTQVHLDHSYRKHVAQQLHGVKSDPEPVREEILTLICHCFVKAGDLTRYVLDAQHASSQNRSKDGVELARSFYHSAQAVVPGMGLIYNQLGAVAEMWDSSAHTNVCLGACMNFALAATAKVPAGNGITNWLRCIGVHRSTLHSFQSNRNLLTAVNKPSYVAAALIFLPRSVVIFPPRKCKFTMLVNTVAMVVVPLYGTCLDVVDVDKCQALWDIAQVSLCRLLVSPSYSKNAWKRDPDEDIVIQISCHSALCLLHAYKEVTSADKIDTEVGYRQHLAFTKLVKIHISIAHEFAQGLVSLVGCLSESFQQHVAVSRCSWALLLSFWSLQACASDDVFVEEYQEVISVLECCKLLSDGLAAVKISTIEPEREVHSEKIDPNRLDYSFLQGCTHFEGLSTLELFDAKCGDDIIETICGLCASAFRCLAARLLSIQWSNDHDLAGVSTAFSNLASNLDSNSGLLRADAEIQKHASYREPSSQNSGSESDELDEILIVPVRRVRAV